MSRGVTAQFNLGYGLVATGITSNEVQDATRSQNLSDACQKINPADMTKISRLDCTHHKSQPKFLEVSWSWTVDFDPWSANGNTAQYTLLSIKHILANVASPLPSLVGVSATGSRVSLPA